MYAKDLNEPKYPSSIKKHEDVGMKHLNNPKEFTEYSNTIDHVYKNIGNCNPNRNRKILIIFDEIITNINTNKKF